MRDEDVWDPAWPDVEGLVVDAVDVVGDVVWIDLHGRQQTLLTWADGKADRELFPTSARADQMQGEDRTRSNRFKR
ncbi:MULTISPECIES: hypothetical protein [Streptomyces]|uniref:Uncharacterized protein n=1 Tax=Streptomyces fimbriatus TaxID=68197 RepID=A0ABW0DDT6_STRFI